MMFEKTNQTIQDMDKPLPPDIREYIYINITAQLAEAINDDEKLSVWIAAALAAVENKVKTQDLWIEEEFRSYFLNHIDSIWTDEFDLAMKKQKMASTKPHPYDIAKNEFQDFFDYVADNSIQEIIRRYLGDHVSNQEQA